MSFLLAVTDFAPGEGVYTADMVAQLAPRLGYRTVAAWDPGLHGWPRFREACLEAGLKPLLGCRFRWRGMAFGALPHSNRGYADLCRLLTDQAHGREGEPPVDCSILAETLEGQEYLTREGFHPALLAHGRNQPEAAAALARGLPAAAPQVLRFRRPEGLELHRLKRAMAERSTVARTEPLWDPRDAAVDRAQWEARFPGAEPRCALEAAAIAERAGGWAMHWGDWVMPRPLGPRDWDLDAELRTRVEAGLPRRYAAVAAEHRARIELELDLIRRKRFAGYFLTVHDLVRAARATRTCGRGSGAASIVSYLLGITNVDPVAANLMFERFLSDARADPPDLDVDFAWDERDEVIASVFRRYGAERVAMVANHVFFKAKGALRDVALAHGRPEADLQVLARLVRGWDEGLPGIAEHPAWGPILAKAQALHGHFHQLSVHPGGTVIAPGPLWHHVPFQPAPAKEGVSITAWDKDGVEGYGLVKIDLLGNRSLAVVRGRPGGAGPGGPGAPALDPAAGPGHPGPAGQGRLHGRLLRGEPGHAPAPAAGGQGRLRDPGDPQLPDPPRRQPLDRHLREARPGRGAVRAQPTRCWAGCCPTATGCWSTRRTWCGWAWPWPAGATRRPTSCARSWASTTAPAGCRCSRSASGPAAPARGCPRR